MLCRSAGHRGRLCGYACCGGHPARRPGRADVRQPRRIHGGFSRLRLARRHRSAAQRRRPRAAAYALPAKLRRSASHHRSRISRRARLYRCTRAGVGAHLVRRPYPAVAAGRQALDHRCAAARRSDPAMCRRSGANAGNPLHVGNDRAVEGRVLPPRAVFLVGFSRHPQSGNPRRRRAFHHVAAVSHQRTRDIPSGLAVRFDARRRAALFRIAFLAASDRTARNHHLSARRHGADPIVQGAVAGRAGPYGALRARARRAGQPASHLRAANRHPSARRLWLDRDQFRHRRHRGRAPRRQHGPRARWL